jgi:glucan phosphorylase
MTDRSYLKASDLAMDRAAIERSFASHVEYGRFSSDETIRGYARDIWRVPVRR